MSPNHQIKTPVQTPDWTNKQTNKQKDFMDAPLFYYHTEAASLWLVCGNKLRATQQCKEYVKKPLWLNKSNETTLKSCCSFLLGVN